ncbi:M3 family oligoendopeptidase [Psychrobacillus psychrodurans]|uniref:M3 family oligoendopeptidase n=1 Tax=Psychrobacillus psychrodurans TaxID=126157 RepID=UPI0008F38E8A|nr:M3 family oligoendopeptidase [Psychrobacillus psychrodurans]MCZ8540606.1 M3 family oligoendopeptidase [Psychrobacillus psychrodurans]SFM66499.1 oligoendopeptidase, pepF/M3 family [Psychrobacillus psychrodurans]
MIEQTYPVVWDLDRFFEGGSNSPSLRSHLDKVKEKLSSFETKLKDFDSPTSIADVSNIEKMVNELKDIATNLSEGGAVIGCFLAQDTTDKQAALLQGEVGSLYAKFSSQMLTIQQVLSKTKETVWEELLQTTELSPFAFVLNEWRDEAKRMLSEKEEDMITTLGVDGYHSWGQLYDLLVGDIRIKLTIDGEQKEMSVGQANNLSSHEDAMIRKESFEALEAAWTDKEEFFAKTLNHIAGFRLAIYEKRGWDSVLEEPLHINRMKEETLNAMWGAISKNKAPFVEYLNKKSAMLGEKQMHWYDLDAPVSTSTEKMDYQQGAEFILKHFKEFGPKLESFSRNAFERGWIEAEDRPNKRPGGFCTGMPVSEESRIFMTYSGSMSNVSTLAHELGHAFHSYALRPVHWMNRQYAMGVAETASTFAEMIVADAAVKEAKTDDEKIALLEDKIQRSVAFFMNIHARFLFETRFYEERKNGIVSAARLNELMELAQQEAYGDALDTTHPHFWASKLHFYITEVPFYNFPYTFGYLFSLSIYAKAISEGANFEEKYIALLQDTAVMSVEDLAMKHLNEDITQEAFWLKGIDLCIQDVSEFIQLTNAKG